GRPVRLTLTTGDDAAEVTIESFSATMQSLGTETVALAPGTSRRAPAAARGAAYVVVTPADGNAIMAGLWQAGDDKLAAAPLRPAPVTVVAPGVSVR
ncbi:hypothetical protein, partial [Aeromicrobium sp.]|uniref:hypothetical protein n=1 Tax=Aeromicrobium sp. TaxID=1871063 RepID=UPI0028A6941E